MKIGGRHRGSRIAARLQRLGERLGAVAERRPPIETGNQRPPADAAGFARAMRLSSEFVAGIVVGGSSAGWSIADAEFSPWGLIVFLLLGFAAGVFNVLRSAG